MNTSIEEISDTLGELGLLSAVQSAAYLNIGQSTFYKYVKLGELPQGILICGRKQWEKKTLHEYFEQRKQACYGAR